MLFNFHTHTTFCDGKNTAEEMVTEAIERGFGALGFSSHAYTDFDTRYCMTDTEGYIAEINRLRQKYKSKIQIYLGTEEDMLRPVDRCRYDYIVGASHYWNIDGRFFDVDESVDTTRAALEAVGGDACELARRYLEPYCSYILERRPDIVAHFDLLTKFDEKYEPIFLGNPGYEKMVEDYLCRALASDCIFEINTGAISRGYRTSPYPAQNLLYLMYKNNAKITISADAHNTAGLSCHLRETAEILRDIGFKSFYALCDGKFNDFDLNILF